MAYIRGIYQIPASRQTFLILSGSKSNDNPKLSLHCLEGMEMLWATLRYKDRMLPKECLKSSVRIVRENDFLSILKDLRLIPKILPNPSSHNPVDMELLAINLLNSNPRDEFSHETPKVLSAISSEDIIEVFI